MALEIVAKSDLNRQNGERNGILDAGEREVVFENNDHVVPCPMFGKEISVSRCPGCRHFHSIGTVQVSGDEAEAPRRFRVVCQHPRHRALLRSAASLSKSYRALLLNAISVREEATQKSQSMERWAFVDESFAVNCPIARAKVGSWRVERPPCPTCEHYKGLIQSPDKPMILCAHPRTIPFRRQVDGSFLV